MEFLNINYLHIELIHQDSWALWEEDGKIEIYKLDNKFFYRESGHSVMADPDTPYWSDFYEVNEDQAIELMLEWVE